MWVNQKAASQIIVAYQCKRTVTCRSNFGLGGD
jgi:hypothetical protein